MRVRIAAKPRGEGEGGENQVEGRSRVGCRSLRRRRGASRGGMEKSRIRMGPRCEVWEGEADERDDAEVAILPAIAVEGGPDSCGEGCGHAEEESGPR